MAIKDMTFWKNTFRITRQDDSSVVRKCPDFSNRDTRGDINSFSAASRRRLTFFAGNIEGDFYQMALTYHLDFPSTGAEIKRHLSNFKKTLARQHPGLRFLWILEFQRRGAPHFHFFVDAKGFIDPEILRISLATAWCKTIKASDESVLWHHHPKNFFPWDMGSGKYLAKYLDKASQKMVPDGFESVGRFWGHSRALQVVTPIHLDIESLVDNDIQKKNLDNFLTRNVSKYLLARGRINKTGKIHPRCFRNVKSFRRYTPTIEPFSRTFLFGAEILKRLICFFTIELREVNYGWR